MKHLLGTILFQGGTRMLSWASAAGFGKWDNAFRDWIARAKSEGRDPNDIGDEAWANDYLAQSLSSRYLAYVPDGGTVLELGPGSGRLTRHLIGRAGRIELVDNSRFVIDWMETYLANKAEFRAQRIATPRLSHIADNSIDTVLAHGVFEHLDFDESYFFLAEFRRVLRPGGHVSFNYNTIQSSGGAEWFLRHKREPGTRCIFRFYTPDFFKRLAEIAGLEQVEGMTSDDRLAHIVLRKAA